jgi:hypothetical protein
LLNEEFNGLGNGVFRGFADVILFEAIEIATQSAEGGTGVADAQSLATGFAESMM